jgi:hypothetical protein
MSEVELVAVAGVQRSKQRCSKQCCCDRCRVKPQKGDGMLAKTQNEVQTLERSQTGRLETLEGVEVGENLKGLSRILEIQNPMAGGDNR